MFIAYPTYVKYRALKLTSPHMKGEDVFALQKALVYEGYNLGTYGPDGDGADGDFGDATNRAVRAYQSSQGLKIDGIAGGYTQKALSRAISSSAAFEHSVPVNRMFGQTEHESSDWLGIYSVRYPNGTYDAGVAQENTGLTPPKEGFDPPKAINALASRVKHYYDHFVGIADDGRRWGLAQGTWNAPAWACYIAKSEGATQVTSGETAKPTATQRQQLEDYIAAVSVYA